MYNIINRIFNLFYTEKKFNNSQQLLSEIMLIKCSVNVMKNNFTFVNI